MDVFQFISGLAAMVSALAAFFTVKLIVTARNAEQRAARPVLVIDLVTVVLKNSVWPLRLHLNLTNSGIREATNIQINAALFNRIALSKAVSDFTVVVPQLVGKEGGGAVLIFANQDYDVSNWANGQWYFGIVINYLDDETEKVEYKEFYYQLHHRDSDTETEKSMGYCQSNEEVKLMKAGMSKLFTLA